MERDSLHGLHQPLSLYKSHSRISIMEQPLVSRSFWSSSPSIIPSKGILRAPPAPFLNQQPPQPPLLPLPAALPRRSSSCPNPSFSLKNGGRKNKKPAKYSTKKNNIPKREEKIAPQKSSLSSSTYSGDFTAELPEKNLARVSSFDPVLFTISPPPSSLPLPTFSLRPKLSCKAVAAGEDAGASDDLRRLLRLQ